MAWVWVLLGICALIVLHEGGHFAAAKAVGMRVERFSLFFGPMFLAKRFGETDYGIGVIPLGGYVKITGMSPDETFEDPEIERRAYINQPVWKRIVVIAAGPLVNLIVAFFIFFGLYLHVGAEVVHPGYQVGSVEPHSAAAGTLRHGDLLVAVDGHHIDPNSSLTVAGTERVEALLERSVDASTCAGGARTDGCVASPAVRLTVSNRGAVRTYALHPRYSAAAKRNLIGFSYGLPITYRGISALTGAHASLKQMWFEISATFSRLAHIYQSKDRRQFHSIAGATTLAEQATSQSASEGLSVMAAISLALAIVNLLPFLPLDGGHIFWALVEKARRGRKVTLVTMERASYIGLALVLALFAIGFSNDISTFVHGGNFLKSAG